MVEKTPYHGLDDYAPGDDNWDHSDLVREVDEVLELRDTLANRPDPANVDIPAGAKFIVDDPGAASHGEVYRFDDTSGSWDLDDRQVSALSAEESVTKSEPVYNVKYWGAKGDGSTDDRQAIQNAIDAAASSGGGTVYFPATSNHYAVGVGGQDPGDVDYALKHKTGVDYVGDGVSSHVKCASTPCHLFFFDGEHDATFDRLKLDGGSHDPDQTDTTNAMCLAIGYKTSQGTSPDTSTGSDDILFRDCIVTGGHRHGTEVAGGSEWVRFVNCTFDDAGADDSVSVTDLSDKVLCVNCISRNKQRNIFSSCGFEADDGPTNVYFINCVSIGDPNNGFNVGKTHVNAVNTGGNHYCINCWAIGSGERGFNCSHSNGGSMEQVHFTECYAIDCNSGFFFGGESAYKDITIRGGGVYNSSAKAVQMPVQNTLEDLTIRNFVIDGAGGHGFDLNPDVANGGVLKNFDIQHTSVKNCSKAPVNLAGDATGYAGTSLIENNRFQGNSWAVQVASSNIRQYVLMRDNMRPADLSPAVPANPVEGMWYLDDGTNTGSGTPGKRQYLNGGWIDAYTA